MKDNAKKKGHLIDELIALRERLAEIEEHDRKQDKELYKILAEHSLAAVFIVQDGKFRFINTSAIAYADYTAEELIGQHADIIVHPEDREMVKERGRAMLRDEDTSPYEYRMVTKEGQIKWIMQIVSPIQYKGKPAILGNAIDITDRKGAEELYKTLAENSLAAVFIVQDGKVRFINTSAISYAGYSAEELIGQHADIIVHPEDRAMVKRKGRDMLMGESTTPYEFRMVTKQEQIRWITQIVSPIQYEGKPAILGNAIDITERKKLEGEILALSNTDQLTGLYNRRGFLALAEQQLKITDRTQKGLLLVFIDLDGMKWINDTLGHKKGDEALVETATILQEVFRKSDITARLGGDEFAVLAIGAATEHQHIIQNRLQKRIDIHNSYENRNYKISMSNGIVYYDPETPCPIDELLSCADALMYEQKRIKKSCST